MNIRKPFLSIITVFCYIISISLYYCWMLLCSRYFNYQHWMLYFISYCPIQNCWNL